MHKYTEQQVFSLRWVHAYPQWSTKVQGVTKHRKGKFSNSSTDLGYLSSFMKRECICSLDLWIIITPLALLFFSRTGDFSIYIITHPKSVVDNLTISLLCCFAWRLLTKNDPSLQQYDSNFAVAVYLLEINPWSENLFATSYPAGQYRSNGSMTSLSVSPKSVITHSTSATSHKKRSWYLCWDLFIPNNYAYNLTKVHDW